MLKKSICTAIFSFSAILPAFSIEVEEFFVEENPYIGISIDFNQFGTMVSMSNLTPKLNPSTYVQNIDRLITTLPQSKSASIDLFKNDKKVLEYIPLNEKFIVKKVLKTAVYEDNMPDEYTIYILEDSLGREYAIPDFELKEFSKLSLTSYEKGLVEKFVEQNNKARVVIYLKKPDLYKDKKPPYSQKDLNSVFDYFLDKMKGYKTEKVLFSDRNFRLSMTINIDALMYIISEFDNLYIEDVEVISEVSRKQEESDYNHAKIVDKLSLSKLWYN